MYIEYIFSSILSTLVTINNLSTVYINKRGTEAEKCEIFNKKNILFDTIFSVIQLNVGYQYLIKPIKLSGDFSWNGFLIVSIIIYFIAGITFALVLLTYYKNFSKKETRR